MPTRRRDPHAKAIYSDAFCATAFEPQTLVDILRWRAHVEPRRVVYPPGVEQIVAFLGCLYAGLVAVPVPLPRPGRGVQRLRAVLSDAQPGLVIGSREVRESLAGADHEGLGAIPWMDDEELAQGDADVWRVPMLSGDGLAYLQYTSGSTSDPKGVMVSHANVLRNFAYIDAGFEYTPETVSPVAFIQRPMRWLELISHHGGTHSGGPNFAYDLCPQRVGPEDLSHLDLRSWAVCYNGAEPLIADTMTRFAETFAPCGFRPHAFYPAYGLAEATLKVSGGR